MSTCPPDLHLHRLRVARPGGDWPWDDEPALPGVLEVRTAEVTHLLACPDAVTLLLSLWEGRPYGAHGQVLRVLPKPPGVVDLEAAWPAGARALGTFTAAAWEHTLSVLAGRCAEVLDAAGERAARGLLAPVLAGRPPASSG